jgi:hypothetical protein
MAVMVLNVTASTLPTFKIRSQYWAVRRSFVACGCVWVTGLWLPNRCVYLTFWHPSFTFKF